MQRVLHYANDPTQRSQDALAARAAVAAAHCGDGWLESLAMLRGSLPALHEPSVVDSVPVLTPGLLAYWARFHSAPRAESPLAFAMRTAESQGLRVRTDITLRDALRKADEAQAARSL